jgi:two-component system, OmpR family, copper resistance phosphate regulon response regulator CusR
MRLLLVEDEEKVVRFVTLGLKAEKFAVDDTRDGRSGLAMALETPYDLLIVDLLLPELSGTELISRLRRHNTTVPIIVLTARDAVDDKVKNFEAGADDYLTKPFAFAELLVRIKALLRRGQVNHSNCLRIAGLEIDRINHHVKRDSITIRLTAKEYALLEYLAVNSGRVLTRTMIVEHVWDQSFEGLTNIVDVYIRQLRAKIDTPFTSTLIHTVRRAGYTLSDKNED